MKELALIIMIMMLWSKNKGYEDKWLIPACFFGYELKN